MRKFPKWIKRLLLFSGSLFIVLTVLFLVPLSPEINQKQKPISPKVQPIEVFADILEKKDNPDADDKPINKRVLNNRDFIDIRNAIYHQKDTSKSNPLNIYTTDFNVFKDPLIFDGNILSNNNEDGPYLENAYFHEDLNFSSCSFDLKPPSNNFIFSNIIVNGNLQINFAALKSQLIFDHCVLNKKTSLISKDTIKKNISFLNCEFFNDFVSASLSSDTTDSSAPAARLKTAGTLRFYGCVFHGKLDLSKGDYTKNSKILLQHCALPNILDLSGVTADQVDLRDEDTTSKICYINLTGFNINKLDIDYRNFQLYFPKDVSNDRVLSCYEKLLAIFKTSGYEESYEKLDAEFRHRQAIIGNHTANEHFYKYIKNISPHFATLSANFLWLSNTLRLPVILDRLNRIWWNYGYDRLRVVYWSLFIVLMFSWFNSFHYKNLLSIYYVRNLDPSGIHYKPNQINYHIVRLWYCFLYTSFVFFKINFDFGKMNFASRYMVILLVQYLIGLVCTGFILNLIISK